MRLQNYKVTDNTKGASAMSKFVTLSMWEETGKFSDCANPGDYVEEAIVEEFTRNDPQEINQPGYVQCGTPFGFEYNAKGLLRPTFTTFARLDGNWVFCGHCFRNEKADARDACKTARTVRVYECV
jgi:hypothetical protein